MSKLLKLLLPFSLSLNLYAGVETVKSFDLDKNQKDDRFEYWLKGKLVRIEEDRNGDAKIDFKTFYNRKPYFEVTEQDADFDGKFERKQSRKYLSKNKSIETLTELDKDQNGRYEISYKESTTSDQKLEEHECFELYVNQAIEDLATGGVKVLSKLGNGFLTTNFGYNIDSGCIDRWGTQFTSIAKKTIQSGMQCLLRLHEESGVANTSTGALRNAHKLISFIDSNRTSIVCSETDFNWYKTMAHASSSNSSSITKPKIEHPFISINPNHPRRKKKPDADELHEIYKTIFHEQMHTLGFRHEENIEYSFACEDCCLDKRMTKKERALSCKICTGNYKNETDKDYVKDIVFYSRKIGQDALGIAAALRYLKESPRDVLGAAFLTYASGNIYNPVAPEFAEIIKEKNKFFTEEQLDLLHEGSQYEESDIFQKSRKSAKLVATGMYEIFVNGNKGAALDLFESNKEMLKQAITAQSGDSKTTKKVMSNLQNMLQTSLRDIWLRTFPIDKTATRAYKLYEYFKS